MSINPTHDQRRPEFFVATPRKDGKFPVSFQFYGTGVRIRKLMTLEQVRSVAASGKYTTHGMVP